MLLAIFLFRNFLMTNTVFVYSIIPKYLFVNINKEKFKYFYLINKKDSYFLNKDKIYVNK